MTLTLEDLQRLISALKEQERDWNVTAERTTGAPQALALAKLQAIRELLVKLDDERAAMIERAR